MAVHPKLSTYVITHVSLTFVVIVLTKMDRSLRLGMAIWRITYCKNYQHVRVRVSFVLTTGS